MKPLESIIAGWTRFTGWCLFTALLFLQLAASTGCKELASLPARQMELEAPSLEEVVQLSDEAMARNNIQLAKVTKELLHDSIEVPAEVRLNPDRVAHVAPLVAGQLQKVLVSVGDTVKKGQKLAVLRSVDLGQARAEYRRSKAMLQAAQANFARQERLRTEGISSERSFLEAQLRLAEAEADWDAGQARLLVFGPSGGSGPDMPIKAPIAGTVVKRHATQGENVSPSDTLFMIADTSKVWVIGHVYEEEMSKIHTDAKITLGLQAYPELSWEGKLAFVAPIVEETTRTLGVRAELDNEDGVLRPGLFGHLRISVSEAEPVVAIPLAASQTLRGATVVFVPSGKPNSFRAKKVVLGRRSGYRVEIREGLEVGNQIVISGAFLLKSQLMAGEFGEEE